MVILLYVGSYCRNTERENAGLNKKGEPADARDLFDAKWLEELVVEIISLYYQVLAREDRPDFTFDSKHFVRRMIDELGVDRCMDEILTKREQERMITGDFEKCLENRGYSAEEIKEAVKGKEDIHFPNGPHFCRYSKEFYRIFNEQTEKIETFETVKGELSFPKLIELVKIVSCLATLAIMERGGFHSFNGFYKENIAKGIQKEDGILSSPKAKNRKPTTKKTPGTDDLLSREKKYIDSLIVESFKMPLSEERKREIVSLTIHNKAPPVLIDVLSGKLTILARGPYKGRKAKVVVSLAQCGEDLGFYRNRFKLGRPIYEKVSYEQKDKELILNVNITQSFALSAATSQLAQLILHPLFELVLGLSHSQANAEEIKYNSQQTKDKAVSDLNVFILEHARRDKSIDYLSNFVEKHPNDPQGAFIKEALSKKNNISSNLKSASDLARVIAKEINKLLNSIEENLEKGNYSKVVAEIFKFNKWLTDLKFNLRQELGMGNGSQRVVKEKIALMYTVTDGGRLAKYDIKSSLTIISFGCEFLQRFNAKERDSVDKITRAISRLRNIMRYLENLTEPLRIGYIKKTPYIILDIPQNKSGVSKAKTGKRGLNGIFTREEIIDIRDKAIKKEHVGIIENPEGINTF